MPPDSGVPSAEPIPALIDSSILISLNSPLSSAVEATFLVRQQPTIACLTKHLTLQVGALRWMISRKRGQFFCGFLAAMVWDSEQAGKILLEQCSGFSPFGKTCHAFLPMMLAKDVANISGQEVTLLDKVYPIPSTLTMW
jgi:hypothetical protein